MRHPCNLTIVSDQHALDTLKHVEGFLREQAAANGRGPRALAYSALATQAWVLRAALTALGSGCEPAMTQAEEEHPCPTSIP